MHLRLLGLFGALLGVAIVLVACSSQNAGLISVTHITPDASVRVLNGSPDLTQVDVTVVSTVSPTPVPVGLATPASTASPSPPVSASLAYKGMSAYGATAGNAPVILTARNHSTGASVFSCTTPELLSADKYTVVIAGRSTSAQNTPTGLQCDVFLENPPTISTNQAVIGFHHAAPAFAIANTTAQGRVLFGTFATGTTTYNTPLGSASFSGPATGTNATSGTAYFGTIAAVTSSPGIGVYASNGTAASGGATTFTAPTSVYTTIFPSAAGIGYSVPLPGSDSADILPFTSSITGLTSYIFNVYLIDSPSGSSSANMAGTLD